MNLLVSVSRNTLCREAQVACEKVRHGRTIADDNRFSFLLHESPFMPTIIADNLVTIALSLHGRLFVALIETNNRVIKVTITFRDPPSMMET